MKVAIPHHGGEVAPCYEYSARISIFSIRGFEVVDRMDFDLKSRECMDRVRLLRDQEVEALICGGLQVAFEDLLRASGIKVISWIAGNVDDVLERFIHGQLVTGSARLGATGS